MNKSNDDRKIYFKLIEIAKGARTHAYVPYSDFAVGAAILADNDEIYEGCNIENSSYGLTMCAERNALASMIVSGEGCLPLTIAIVGSSGEPCYPCGACRQVLSEFNPSMTVILENGGDLEIRSLEDYLPFRFVIDR